MKIIWHGHSVIEIITADKTDILIDPFITDNPLTDLKVEECQPDFILVTHAHFDHVGDTVEIAQRTGATIVAVTDLAGYFEEKGLKAYGINFGGSLKTNFGSIKLVPAWHTAALPQKGSDPRTLGVAAGFELHVDGKVLYDAGDTALFSDMQLLNGGNGVDLAFLPIGDYYTMGPDDAIRAASFVKAKRVLPIHYNTFPQIKQDVAAYLAKLAPGVGIKTSVGKIFEI
ncbi:metal-dependent hydrolase [Liquorilactobacillus sucicola DSM 21376 = JCM 15457]|nr:metal-dependent hydrolase [Liquorilactobacillus sucicola]GAJ25986.1 metal-dependent hydrolase [Liquorilactobacillus sucicola DSM 21376 = JCM 15457]